MIVDLARATPGSVSALPADAVVVVGSGAAGMALALALEDAGRPVVLVESGGDPRDAAGIDSRSGLNEGVVVGQAYRGLAGARARVLGGATQLWHGQCTRMHPLDLAPRPWVRASGWPLGYDDLTAWYPVAERWFGLTGRGYGADRWAEHPGVLPLPWRADRLLPDFTEYTPQPFLGTAHGRRLERSTTTTVLSHATVTRVLLREEDGPTSGRAVGVEVSTLDGRRHEVLGDSVVLAAGAIENARILMLSDPAGTGLGAGREHTGRFLQDHPVVDLLELTPTDPAALQDRTAHLYRRGTRLWPKVRLAPGAQEQERLLDANAVVVHEHDDGAMDAARRLVGGLRRRALPEGWLADVRTSAGVVGPLLRAAYRRRFKGLSAGRPSTRTVLQVWLEQEPDADSRVRLGDGTDPLGLPVAQVDWRLGPAELRTSRVLARWVAEDLEAHGLATVTELPAMTDDDAWRATVVDAYHPSGTTRMSSSPADGVVDADGQVHGVERLFVAGSSVFPVAGYANPTLTIVALALRLADHLVRSVTASGDQPAWGVRPS